METKEDKYYEYDKEKWVKIIELAGFKKESYDKIHEYIDNHVRYELKYPILFNEELKESSLPQALRVLAELDKKNLLNKIVFVSQTSGKEIFNEKEYNYFITPYGYQFGFKNGVDDKQEYYVNEFIKTTVEQFEVMLNHNDDLVFVFILFARTIKPEPYKFKVFHKYYQPNKEENNNEKCKECE